MEISSGSPWSSGYPEVQVEVADLDGQRGAAEVVDQKRQQDDHQDADHDPDQRPHEPWDAVAGEGGHQAGRFVIGIATGDATRGRGGCR